MSTIDLMLLGVLMEKPLNAYEIKKMMEFRNIKYWIKISAPSIYKNLIALHKKGYVDGEVVREGEMPEKTVYSVNDKGRRYFNLLMEEYSGKPGNIYFDFTAFIANLKHVDTETGKRMIARLREKLQLSVLMMSEAKTERRGYNLPYNATALIELYQQLNSLLADWIVKFENEYDGSS